MDTVRIGRCWNETLTIVQRRDEKKALFKLNSDKAMKCPLQIQGKDSFFPFRFSLAILLLFSKTYIVPADRKEEANSAKDQNEH